MFDKLCALFVVLVIVVCLLAQTKENKDEQEELLYKGATKIGYKNKTGVTVVYRVIKLDTDEYKNIFIPGAKSRKFDVNARYLYMYQARNDSGFEGELEALAIKLLTPDNAITSWGYLKDFNLRYMPVRKVAYYTSARPVPVQKQEIILVAGEKPRYVSPDKVSLGNEYVLVDYETPVAANAFSRTVAFTSNYAPTFSEVQLNDRYKGSVPVPYDLSRQPLLPSKDAISTEKPSDQFVPPAAPPLQIPVPTNLGLSTGSGMGGLGGFGNSGTSSGSTLIKTESNNTVERIINNEKCCDDPDHSLIVPEPPHWVYFCFCVLYLVLVARVSYKTRNKPIADR